MLAGVCKSSIERRSAESGSKVQVNVEVEVEVL